MLGFLILVVLWFRPRWSGLAGWSVAFAVIMTAMLWASHRSLTEGAADDLWLDLVDRAVTNVLVFVVLGSGIVLLRKSMQRRKQQAIVTSVTRSNAGSASNDAQDSVAHSEGGSIQPLVSAQTIDEGGAAELALPQDSATESELQSTTHGLGSEASIQVSSSIDIPKGEMPGAKRARPESGAVRSGLSRAVREANWQRGVTRVFWVSALAWWGIAAVWVVQNVEQPREPRLEAFAEQCSPAHYDQQCQSLWRIAREDFRECDRRRLFGEQLSSALPCETALNAAEERRAQCNADTVLRVRACRTDRASDVGQRRIAAQYQTAFISWQRQSTIDFLATLAAVLAAPFLLWALAFCLLKLGRWIWQGFRAAV